MLIRFAFASLLCSLCMTSQAQEAYWVSKVFDGDTVELQSATGRLKLRLTDIDAPERNQEYGQKSRRALIKLCKGDNVSISVAFIGKDKYDRNLGRLQCNQTDASLYLAQHGYAWHNEKYSNDAAIKAAVAKAREKRIGLWSSEDPVAPWVWRHLNMPN
jgi:endonuclease YncB( thermonuclease family)